MTKCDLKCTRTVDILPISTSVYNYNYWNPKIYIDPNRLYLDMCEPLLQSHYICVIIVYQCDIVVNNTIMCLLWRWTSSLSHMTIQ